ADDVDSSRNLHAQINAHDPLLRCWLWLRERERNIRDPFAAFALDAEQSWLAGQRYSSAANGDLLDCPTLEEWEQQPGFLNPPVLVVPLTDGLAEERDNAKIERAFPDGAGITQCLIFDGTWQGGAEVFSACTFRKHITVQGLHQHVDRADVFLTVCHQKHCLI